MPNRLKRYNFRFFYDGGQDTEGQITDKAFPIDARNIEEALDEYFREMKTTDESGKDWVLIGTTINGMDAAKFIRRERELRMGHVKELEDIMDRRVVITTPNYNLNEIPTPEDLGKLKVLRARNKYHAPIRTSILKAMYDGLDHTLVEKNLELDSVWTIVFTSIEDEFEAKGWELFVKVVNRDVGPDYQSRVQDYYHISWDAKR